MRTNEENYKNNFINYNDFIVGLFLYLFIGKPNPAEKTEWGVTFSKRYAIDLGLDWQKAFSAILDDLKRKESGLLLIGTKLNRNKENMILVIWSGRFSRLKDTADKQFLHWAGKCPAGRNVLSLHGRKIIRKKKKRRKF